MKGVILSITPDVQIADITHSISPQNVMEAAIALSRAAPYFPEETVHVAVVDPGVGTSRRAIAGRIGQQYFVAPDNGLLTLIINRAEQRGETVKLVHLDQPRYWLADVSSVFHGRDIFAPVAAYLSGGVALEKLGAPIEDAVRLKVPTVEEMQGRLRGRVISIDNFGNLATNIRREHLREKDLSRVRVLIGETEVYGMVKTFGERPEGELIALFGTTDDLIVSVVNGSAADRLNAGIGAPVEVTSPA
jgi:S-adenosylmethionine hydrolase